MESVRKEAFRYPFKNSIPIRLKIIGINGKRVISSETIAKLIDLSPSGLRIETLLQIPVSHNIEVEVEFKLNEVPFNYTGILKWHQYTYYGVALNTSKQDQERLLMHLKNYTKSNIEIKESTNLLPANDAKNQTHYKNYSSSY